MPPRPRSDDGPQWKEPPPTTTTTAMNARGGHSSATAAAPTAAAAVAATVSGRSSRLHPNAKGSSAGVGHAAQTTAAATARKPWGYAATSAHPRSADAAHSSASASSAAASSKHTSKIARPVTRSMTSSTAKAAEHSRTSSMNATTAAKRQTSTVAAPAAVPRKQPQKVSPKTSLQRSRSLQTHAQQKQPQPQPQVSRESPPAPPIASAAEPPSNPEQNSLPIQAVVPFIADDEFSNPSNLEDLLESNNTTDLDDRQMRRATRLGQKAERVTTAPGTARKPVAASVISKIWQQNQPMTVHKRASIYAGAVRVAKKGGNGTSLADEPNPLWALLNPHAAASILDSQQLQAANERATANLTQSRSQPDGGSLMQRNAPIAEYQTETQRKGVEDYFNTRLARITAPLSQTAPTSAVTMSAPPPPLLPRTPAKPVLLSSMTPLRVPAVANLIKENAAPASSMGSPGRVPVASGNDNTSMFIVPSASVAPAIMTPGKMREERPLARRVGDAIADILRLQLASPEDPDPALPLSQQSSAPCSPPVSGAINSSDDKPAIKRAARPLIPNPLEVLGMSSAASYAGGDAAAPTVAPPATTIHSVNTDDFKDELERLNDLSIEDALEEERKLEMEIMMIEQSLKENSQPRLHAAIAAAAKSCDAALAVGGGRPGSDLWGANEDRRVEELFKSLGVSL